MLSGLLGVGLTGCGRAPEPQAIAPDERGLKELGGVYRDFAARKKRAPKSLKDLNIQGQHDPIAVEMIRSGDLIVQWGAPMSPEGATAGSVLAYVKTVPEQGDDVLMDDGRTIKKMTPEEFKAAPKAVGR